MRVAGCRWTIEESFQAGKGLTGLDEHQLRRWLPWRRWILLAVIAATERAEHPPPAGLIALTQRCTRFPRRVQPLDPAGAGFSGGAAVGRTLIAVESDVESKCRSAGPMGALSAICGALGAGRALGESARAPRNA